MNDIEYVCDDRSIELSENFKNMSDAEMEQEFQLMFGQYLNDNE